MYLPSALALPGRPLLVFAWPGALATPFPVLSGAFTVALRPLLAFSLDFPPIHCDPLAPHGNADVAVALHDVVQESCRELCIMLERVMDEKVPGGMVPHVCVPPTYEVAAQLCL